MPNLTKTQLNQPPQNSTDVSNDTTAPSQEDHADALGVQSRGGGRGNQYQSGNPKFFGIAPSQDHTEAPEKPCKGR